MGGGRGSLVHRHTGVPSQNIPSLPISAPLSISLTCSVPGIFRVFLFLSLSRTLSVLLCVLNWNPRIPRRVASGRKTGTFLPSPPHLIVDREADNTSCWIRGRAKFFPIFLLWKLSWFPIFPSLNIRWSYEELLFPVIRIEDLKILWEVFLKWALNLKCFVIHSRIWFVIC